MDIVLYGEVKEKLSTTFKPYAQICLLYKEDRSWRLTHYSVQPDGHVHIYEPFKDADIAGLQLVLDEVPPEARVVFVKSADWNLQIALAFQQYFGTLTVHGRSRFLAIPTPQKILRLV